MTELSNIQEQINNILVKRVHIEVTSSDTDLIDSGLLDSLSLVELMVGLEEVFGVTIAFDEIEIDNFRSVEKITEYVNQQKNAAEPVYS